LNASNCEMPVSTDQPDRLLFVTGSPYAVSSAFSSILVARRRRSEPERHYGAWSRLGTVLASFDAQSCIGAPHGTAKACAITSTAQA
jgi:hypothetical protein